MAPKKLPWLSSVRTPGLAPFMPLNAARVVIAPEAWITSKIVPSLSGPSIDVQPKRSPWESIKSPLQSSPVDALKETTSWMVDVPEGNSHTTPPPEVPPRMVQPKRSPALSSTTLPRGMDPVMAVNVASVLIVLPLGNSHTVPSMAAPTPDLVTPKRFPWLSSNGVPGSYPLVPLKAGASLDRVRAPGDLPHGAVARGLTVCVRSAVCGGAEEVALTILDYSGGLISVRSVEVGEFSVLHDERCGSGGAPVAGGVFTVDVNRVGAGAQGDLNCAVVKVPLTVTESELPEMVN